MKNKGGSCRRKFFHKTKSFGVMVREKDLGAQARTQGKKMRASYFTLLVHVSLAVPISDTCCLENGNKYASF